MSSLSKQELETLMTYANISACTLVATAVLLVYDYLLTFGEEKRLIWSSRLSLAKIAFMLNRYLPLLTLPGLFYAFVLADSNTSVSTCVRVSRVFSSMNLAIYFIAEFILYLRAYAVWGGDRGVFAALALGYTSLLVVAGYFATKFIWDINTAGITLPRPGCVMTFNGQLDWPAYVALLVSETFSMLILVLKTLQMRFSATMHKIFADGALYYLLTLCTTVANILVLRLAPAPLCNFLLALQAVLHSIISNHLLLRIRGAYHPIASITTAQFGIDFAMSPISAASESAVTN